MKKRTMNELRQTKEYKLSDQGGEYTVPYKGADPVQVVLAQQIEELAHADGIKEMVNKHQEDLDKASAEGSKKFWSEEMLQAHGKYDGDINKEEEMEECPLDPVEEAKILIVDKITKHLSDVIFENVCKEMSNHYVFQSQNYLTEAGYEQFEDEWFEFYQEHHGDILYEVMKNITN